MAVTKRLGKGLGALFNDGQVAAQPAPPPANLPAPPPAPPPAPAAPVTVQPTVAVEDIQLNPLQPRKQMAAEALAELVNSMREKGVLQPLLVRRVGGKFELIAGERRLRAARQLGLSQVPVVIKEDISDQAALEMALVENLMRDDLNAIEEADGYQMLVDKFALNQDQIAQRVGKARATVANALRLLALPGDIKQMIVEGKLSGGHAKALLGIALDEEKSLYARRAAMEGWSVRMLEKAVARLSRAPRKPRGGRVEIAASHLQYLSDKLHRHFGTSVRIVPPRTLANGKKVKGTIEIDFFSNDDLTRILELLGIVEDV